MQVNKIYLLLPIKVFLPVKQYINMFNWERLHLNLSLCATLCSGRMYSKTNRCISGKGRIKWHLHVKCK